MEFFFRKNFMPPKLHAEVMSACDFPDLSAPACGAALVKVDAAIGPANIYNVYDNCPATGDFLERTGKSMSWLRSYLQEGLSTPHLTHAALVDLNGGYEWACGGQAATEVWLNRSDVRAALHLS